MAEPISIESITAVKENRISFFEHRNKIIGNLCLFPSFRLLFSYNFSWVFLLFILLTLFDTNFNYLPLK